MQLANVKSGYDQSKAQYELVLHEEQNATLAAPFDGIVANLFAKPHNIASTSEAGSIDMYNVTDGKNDC